MSKPVLLLVLFILLALAIGIAHRDEFVHTRVVVGPPEYVVARDAFKDVLVTAASFIVFDVSDGRVFAEREADTVREMASITKLITADMALGTSTVDASTTISWRAVVSEGRSGGLEAGQRYRVRELVFPLLLESSNDAAEAIAEANGRTQFIKGMNARADELGMSSTDVVDPSGLGRGNVSTARDLMKLMRHLYANHRHVLDITTLTSYVSEEHIWQNNDPVMSSDGFIGGKHGYTDTAGRTIALIVEERFTESSSVRPIGIILLDSDDLTGDVARLRDEFRRTVTLPYSL
jgi:D-alanyl-D-alanine carboxypeptidase